MKNKILCIRKESLSFYLNFNLLKIKMPWIISLCVNKDFVTLNQITALLFSESCLQAQWVPNLSNRSIYGKTHTLADLVECEYPPQRRNFTNLCFFYAKISIRYFLLVELYQLTFSKFICRSVQNIVCLNPK